jgi:hypothetical protein
MARNRVSAPHRPYTASELPPPLRLTLGIQLAPPAVGCSAYLSISSGNPSPPSADRGHCAGHCVAAAQGTIAPASASAATRKPPPRAAGYIEYRPPEWRPADPGAPESMD